MISNKKNQGTYKSANIGLKYAKGEYIARLDSDDKSLPNRLQEQIDFLDNNKDIKLIGSWCLKINDKNFVLGIMKPPIHEETILGMIFFTNVIAHSSIMFRKKFIESIGNYNESERTSQDYELYLKVIKNQGNICNLDKFLIEYRTHSQNITSKNSTTQLKSMEKTLQKYLKSILGIEIEPKKINLMRRIYLNELDGINRNDKLQLIKYLITFNKKFRKKFPQKLYSHQIAWEQTNIILTNMIFNKFLRKLFRLYILFKIKI